MLSRRSVYCSKAANGKYSISETFDNENGNIIFNTTKHTWKNKKCKFCGAAQEVYDRGVDLENYAYRFIHTNKPQKIFNMKFDVIIGNPPYQLSDGGHGRSASPIYHKFIEQAKKLKPRFLTMIIPARWYAGGKGLDDFRKSMLNDSSIRKLVDFESSSDVFPGVDIADGICYFLWDRDNEGLCEITNEYNGKRISSERALNEFDVFIRHSKAVPIIRKVTESEDINGIMLSDIVSPSKPFGLRTFYKPKKQGIPCWFTQRVGFQFATPEDVHDKNQLLKKWKLLVPTQPIAGQTDFSKPVGFYYNGNTRIAKPGEICTESWLVACSFSTEAEVLSFKSYLFTKIVRFLLLQTVVSQHVTREKFVFIPDMEKYDIEFTDDILRERWNITDEEWSFIDSKIKAVELINNKSGNE